MMHAVRARVLHCRFGLIVPVNSCMLEGNCCCARGSDKADTPLEREREKKRDFKEERTIKATRERKKNLKGGRERTSE